MNSLQTQVISEHRVFASLAEEWDAIARASVRPSPFLLHGWIDAWWSVYRPDAPKRFVTVRESGSLVGALALTVTRSGPVRVGRLAGAPLLGDALVAGADPRAVIERMATAVRAEAIDVLDLEGLAPRSLLATHLPDLCRARIVDAIPAPRLEIPDGWDASYRRAASANTRHNHKRRWNRLQGAGQVRFVRHTREEDVVGALADVFRLHGLRWVGEHRDTSPFATPLGQAHNRRALATLARAGHAGVLELRLDDVVIGSQVYLVLEGTLFLYRVAFDPAVERLSPGVQATLETIRQLASEGVTRVELGRGDERYKLEIATDTEQLVRLIAQPAGVRGAAYLQAAAGAIAMRRGLRDSERARRAYGRARKTADRLRRRTA